MRKDEMTVTEALAYIADLQAHPEVQLVNHRKLLKAAAVLAAAVNLLSEERKHMNLLNDNSAVVALLNRRA